jgi:hypothetical protein
VTSSQFDQLNGVDESGGQLTLQITEPMPRLEVALRMEDNERVVNLLYAGTVQRLYLVLHNSGQIPLTELYFTHSDTPHFVLDPVYSSFMMAPSDSESPFKRLKGDSGPTSSLSTRSSHSGSVSVYVIPLPGNNQLGPGETVSVPLWYHAATNVTESKLYTHKFVFQYKSVSPNTLLPFRVTCAIWTVTILPALHLTAYIRPSSSSISHYLLALELENLSHNAIIQLKSLKVWSRVWTVTHLTHSTHPSSPKVYEFSLYL